MIYLEDLRQSTDKLSGQMKTVLVTKYSISIQTWTEEPGGVQSMGVRVGHDSDSTTLDKLCERSRVLEI